MSEFSLDHRLAEDTFFIADLYTSELRLMNDSRWPWLILVPKIADAVEWHELHTDQRQDIDFEIANLAAILKANTGCKKVNIASLGNMVRQLHIHIIARSEDDENWPGPVWGFGKRVPYQRESAKVLISSIQKELGQSA
ncbi:MAG: HIT family protein [Pseudomonadota bacterium]